MANIDSERANLLLEGALDSFHEFGVIAEVGMADGFAVAVHEDVEGNTVDIEAATYCGNLFGRYHVVLAFDVWKHGNVVVDVGTFIGDVYPHDVIVGEFAGFQWFVGLECIAARTTPCVPEVYEHHFALMGSYDGVEQLVGRYVGVGGSFLLDDFI